MTRPTYIIRECLYCGPRKIIYRSERKSLKLDAIVCPTCGLDPAEVRMTEDVIARGFEACYQEEVRRERVKRSVGTSG